MKRVKRRYLVLLVDSDSAPSPKELMDAIWSAVVKLYGEVGASQTSLSLIEYNAEKKVAVIRTALAKVNLVRASLATITSVAGKDAALHVLTVSGTIKALRKFL
ncbi:MAG: Rpp14/Pop5 family protein [Candidatus Bathyarchaeales archaeon]